MYLRDGAVTAIVLTGGYYYCSYTFFHPYQYTAGTTGQAYENRKSPSCYDPAGTKAQR